MGPQGLGSSPAGGEVSTASIQGETNIRKRSVLIAGHATSVSLEEAFWRGLKKIAEARGKSVNGLITEIDSETQGNLSSAIRVFVLNNVVRD
ncbi:MAG: ribbon-helix-helix domain-containing protein [Rhodospirillales bacterium]|nr:ribbon-helix-helix domain-containing protein [Rhodospirillales bacterium]